MSITICDTRLTRTVRYLSLTFEPVYLNAVFISALSGKRRFENYSVNI